jgi:hypothetical protein
MRGRYIESKDKVSNEKTRKRKEILRKLPVERRDDLANGLGSASGRRDDVVVDATSATPVLVRRAVDSLLSRGGGVDGSHQTFDDTKVVVNNLGERGEAVGRAGRIRDL